MKAMLKRLEWYALKLPLLFLLLVGGLMLEWAVSLPFIVACWLDRRGIVNRNKGK